MDVMLGWAMEPAGLRSIADRMAATGDVVGCGEGWMPLVVQLDQRLAQIDPDYRLFGVGRRGATLMYDAEPSSPRLREQFAALIGVAVLEASRTCEVCGDTGERREIAGLVEVLCPVHEWTAETAGAWEGRAVVSASS